MLSSMLHGIVLANHREIGRGIVNNGPSVRTYASLRIVVHLITNRDPDILLPQPRDGNCWLCFIHR